LMSFIARHTHWLADTVGGKGPEGELLGGALDAPAVVEVDHAVRRPPRDAFQSQVEATGLDLEAG
jgi:hypothetical protein